MYVYIMYVYIMYVYKSVDIDILTVKARLYVFGHVESQWITYNIITGECGQ